MTSCVSSRHSTSETTLTTPRVAFFGVKTEVGKPIAVALRWRYGGATLVLQGSRHQTDTKIDVYACSNTRILPIWGSAE